MLMMGNQAPFCFLLLMGEGFGLGMSFDVLQISVQEDVEERDVSVATSFAYLLRILSQTFMSSIYGVILNHALTRGIAESHGQITIATVLLVIVLAFNVWLQVKTKKIKV